MWMWNRDHMMNWSDSAGMGIMGVIGILVTLLLIIILLLVIFTVIKILKSNKTNEITPTQMPSNNEALNILQARYAKGEINEEEYLNMKKVIQNNDDY